MGESRVSWTPLRTHSRATPPKKEKKAEDADDIAIDPDGACAVFIFKTLVDQFGKMSIFKVMNGTLKRDTVLKNKRAGTQEKFSHIYILKGNKQTEVSELCCGDIGMISKLASAATGDTFSAGGDTEYRRIHFPVPYMRRAIVTAAKGDEDKISSAIQKLLDEDPTMKYENNSETKQMLISGMGDIHIDVITSKLKSRYGISINLSEPKIAYRETIKKERSGRRQAQKAIGRLGSVRACKNYILTR